MKIDTLSTPNPNSMKFLFSQTIAPRTADFGSAGEAQGSPLAAKIFGFPWADGVFIGPDFVTITKQDWVEWEILAEPLRDLLFEHVNSGLEVLTESSQSHNQETPSAKNADEQTIIDVLNSEIRPAVQMDGGDIVFQRFENNKVYVYMTGACSGCPSSTMTLKEGVERRLKQALPQITEVISL